jgi:hypothetical protein
MSNPVEHDERWLELQRDVNKALFALDSRRSTLMHVAGFRKHNSKYDQSWYDQSTKERATLDDAIAICEAKREEYVPSYSGTHGKHLDAFQSAQVTLELAVNLMRAHEANYTGWNRFFLVTSSNGLVHSTMSCSTCNKGRSMTTFAMLPKLSGLGHEFAVEALGASLCSVCFPEAPTEWTDEVKIPARIAELLVTVGPAAFEAELKKYNDKRAAKAATK